MMNELQIFENVEFGKIRTLVHDGKPYAVGVDVARVLEYSKPSQAVINHCKGILKLGIPSYNQRGARVVQRTNVIPEGDIYRLIIKSAEQSKSQTIKEKATKFEKWLFEEVLPAIRQTGTYSINQDNVIKALTEEVCRLTEIVTKMQSQVQAQLHQYPTMLLTGNQQYDGNLNIAAKKKWMRKFNQCMDMLEEKFNLTRNELLHQLYVFLENNMKVILNEERIRCMERLDIDDCSCLEAIYHNRFLRKELQRLIELNLS